MQRPINLLAVLAFLAACASAAPGKPSLLAHNPDGTVTVRKDARSKKGLVIPPQVVVPFVTKSSKK